MSANKIQIVKYKDPQEKKKKKEDQKCKLI
jgi:hypothetical protein